LDLRRRATDPELLDEGVPDAEALRSLGDLRFVNRWLGTERSVLAMALPQLRGLSRPRLLDVGAGSGDLSAALRRSCPGLCLAVALDLKLLHLRQAPAGVARVVADVGALPFGPASFDVVTASLFLHHFDGSDAARVVRGLFALTRGALIVHDLRRARVPYLFARAMFPWLLRSPVSVSDGLLSIRRAFTRSELAAIFSEAGIPDVRIEARFPYRLVAMARKAA
jgi:2-polyprenyl-3-methyl-5-hydroxy-6-metoxy-1,4-benzoquinol methylase